MESMPRHWVAALFVASLALALLPSVALAAETFTLPGQELFLYQFSYYEGGGPYPDSRIMSIGYEDYTHLPVIFYRVLVDGNGQETVLDHYRTTGRMVYSRINDIQGTKYFFFDLLPLNVTLDGPGTYYVELRRIDLNRPTVEKNPVTDLGSVIDSWGVKGGSIYDMTMCTNTYHTSCYYEYLMEQNVPIESLAQTLSVTEIELAGDGQDVVVSERPSMTGMAGNPFDPNTGDTQKQSSIPLAVAAFGGVALVSAAVVASGSRIRTFLTNAGVQAENARQSAYAQMEEERQMYAEWYAGVQAKKAKEKQAAAFAAAQAEQQARADQFNADLAKIQNGKMSAADAGSALATLTIKYSDILTDDGKKRLMQASNDAWAQNRTMTATAVSVPVVMAKQTEPIQVQGGQAAKQDVLGNLWNGIIGAPYKISDYLYSVSKSKPNTLQSSIANNLMNNLDNAIGVGEGAWSMVQGLGSLAGMVADGAKQAIADPVSAALGAVKTVAVTKVLGPLGLAAPAAYQYVTDREFRDGANAAAAGMGSSMFNFYAQDWDTHPGRVVGRVGFDVATFAVPAGEVGKAGTAAKLAEGARLAKGAEEARGLTAVTKLGGSFLDKDILNRFVWVRRLQKADIAKLVGEDKRVYEGIMKYVNVGENALAKANKLLTGEARSTVKNIGFVKNDWLTWLARNTSYDRIYFNLRSNAGKVLAKAEDFKQLVKHEYLHSAGLKFDEMVKANIEGTAFVWKTVRNEAHDLITLKLQKAIEPAAKDVVKNTNAYVESLLNRTNVIVGMKTVVKSGNFQILNSKGFLHVLKSEAPFVSEWLVANPNAIKTVKALENMAIQTGNKEVLNVIKEIYNLKNTYDKILLGVHV